MRNFYLLFLGFFIQGIVYAQPTSIYTIDNSQPTAGSNFNTFNEAITLLNGGITGHVIFDVAAGKTFYETLDINFQGSASSTVIFRKAGAGANPKISRIGTSATNEYILRLMGADFLTFDGIDFEQTGTSGSDWIEYGIYLVNASTTNGSQNNMFKNGVVSLSNANVNARAVFLSHSPTPTNASGTNSNNKFLNMVVRNSFVGYYFGGTAINFPDNGNEVGTESGGVSQIQNLGNGTAAAIMYAVFAGCQTNFKLRNTNISNLLNGGSSSTIVANFATAPANSVEVSGNTFSNITAGGSVTALAMSNGSSINIFNNRFSAIRTTTAVASPIKVIELLANGVNTNVYSNQIYDISSFGLGLTTLSAIEVGSGSSHNIFNNMISDLRAPGSTNTTGSVKGIAIVGGSAGSVVRIYYNTVLLSDVATAANYTSAGIFNSTTTPILDIRNNIIVNKSDVTTGIRAVAFWKNAATVVDVNSDNNLYYAGTPGAKNLIYYDGTNNIQQINDYKALTGISPRELNSGSENIVTLPITLGVIRLDPSSSSMAESGGKEISGYTLDFEGTQRGPYPIGGQVNGAGTKPDMGADEYDGRAADILGPVINFTALGNTSLTANRTLVVTITDASSVRTGADGPRLYYRKSGSSIYMFDDNPSINGDQYTFTFDHSAIGGVAPGDAIEYYVAAQDQAGYMTTSPFGGTGAYPPGTTPPSAYVTYRILNGTAGAYTVGATGTFLNLTAVASFLNNAAEVTGHTLFELQADYDGTTGETFPIQFNQFETNNTSWIVTIRPAAGVTARVTSGDPNTSNSLITLNGVDRLVFDGRPAGTGTANEWTFRNTRTASVVGSVFMFRNGATNDTLRYLNIEGQPTSTGQGVVILAGVTTGTVGNSFNTIANNRIGGRTDVATVASIGVYVTGSAAAPNTDIMISDNQIVNFANNGIHFAGDGNGNGSIITGNHIYGDITTSVAKHGINLGSNNATNTKVMNNYIGGSGPNATGLMTVNGDVIVAGITVANGGATLSNNTIANMVNASTGVSAKIRGINITSIYPATDTIRNNTIYNLSTSSAAVGTSPGNQVAAGILIAPNNNTSLVQYAVHQNTVYNISIENVSPLTSTNLVAGMVLYNLQNTSVANNRVYDIKNKTTGTTLNQPPVSAGIFNSSFNNTAVANNMISLGTTESNNTQFIGIMQLGRGSGNVHNYYYNSVYIGGTVVGANFSSYGFARGLDTTTEQHQVANLVNNIFYINRTGGSAANYPIASRGLIPGGGWTSNYNDLYNSTAANVGYWNSTGYDLAGWRTASANDANSKVVVAEFINPLIADLHLTGGSVGNVQLGGVVIPVFTNDFDLQPRNSIRPYMGADEGAIGLPVRLEYFKGARQNNVHVLSWKGQCTGNDNSFTVERSGNGRDFTAIGEVNASRTDCDFALALTDRNPLPGINYYRLKIKDENGRISYSIIIAILNKENGFEIVSVFPTLAKANLFVNVTSSKSLNLNISITDAYGRTVQNISKTIQQGSSLISLDVSPLAAGTYIFRCVTMEGYEEAIRFIKQ